mmetsp:Transcript_8306/g.14461  ORF Transcript_8306/g.14461 Transcript_8306/m.14461 type:complete len:93 (+) Transcript_8306:563-841(+)
MISLVAIMSLDPYARFNIRVVLETNPFSVNVFLIMAIQNRHLRMKQLQHRRRRHLFSNALTPAKARRDKTRRTAKDGKRNMDRLPQSKVTQV